MPSEKPPIPTPSHDDELLAVDFGGVDMRKASPLSGVGQGIKIEKGQLVVEEGNERIKDPQTFVDDLAKIYLGYRPFNEDYFKKRMAHRGRALALDSLANDIFSYFWNRNDRLKKIDQLVLKEVIQSLGGEIKDHDDNIVTLAKISELIAKKIAQHVPEHPDV